MKEERKRIFKLVENAYSCDPRIKKELAEEEEVGRVHGEAEDGVGLVHAAVEAAGLVEHRADRDEDADDHLRELQERDVDRSEFYDASEAFFFARRLVAQGEAWAEDWVDKAKAAFEA